MYLLQVQIPRWVHGWVASNILCKCVVLLFMHDTYLHRWMITESNDVKQSGNSGVWKEMLEKLKSVVAMFNDDFITIQRTLEDEEKTRKLKHATLQEIAQLESDLQEIKELETKIDELKSNVVQQKAILGEEVEALNADFPEAGLTADSDIATKHTNILLAYQEKEGQLRM